LVTDICGLLAAAKVTVRRGVKGPSNADRLVGDCVAKLTNRLPGRVAAAPPSTQSSIAFCIASDAPIYAGHPALMSIASSAA
jgi:hypothetical protein